MKKLVFILAFLLPLSLIAQNALEVTGHPTKARAAKSAKNIKATEVNISPVSGQVAGLSTGTSLSPVSVAGYALPVGQTTGESIMTMGYPVNKVNLSELISRYAEDPAYSSFEIDEEMFKAFGELEYVDSMSMALFKKIKSVKMLELQRTEEEMIEMEGEPDPYPQPVDPRFYTEITSQLDITGYTQLLKSRNNHSIALLLKKENNKENSSVTDNEFILITERMVIYIRGNIVIKTIYQMEEMMGYVRQILPN